MAFALDHALDVKPLMKDERSLRALVVCQGYIDGKATTEEDLAEAARAAHIAFKEADATAYRAAAAGTVANWLAGTDTYTTYRAFTAGTAAEYVAAYRATYHANRATYEEAVVAARAATSAYYAATSVTSDRAAYAAWFASHTRLDDPLPLITLDRLEKHFEGDAK